MADSKEGRTVVMMMREVKEKVIVADDVQVSCVTGHRLIVLA